MKFEQPAMILRCTAGSAVFGLVFTSFVPVMLLLFPLAPLFVGAFEFYTCEVAGKARATIAKFRVCKALKKMSELRTLLEDVAFDNRSDKRQRR